LGNAILIQQTMLNRNETLNGFNIGAIFVCLFFAVFLSVFVTYSRFYSLFIIGSVVFALNHFILLKGYYKAAFCVYVITTNLLVLIFDDGMMSNTRSFVFYIPLLLCNLIISNYKKPFEQFLSVGLTVFCILLTSFTNLTPKLSQLLYNNEHQAIVTYFNTFVAMGITVIMAFLLSKSAREAQHSLIANKLVSSKNELLLKSINQNIDIGICRTDVASNRLIYANNAQLKLFGYDTQEELLAVTPHDFYKDEAERKKVLDLLEKNGFISNLEVHYKRKDGTLFWGLLTSNILVEENGKVIYDGAIRDISEFKKLKEELVIAKELAEKSSLAKSQFLSTMSHEIRTPMNAVIGASNLLLQDEPNKEQLENLLLLKSAGNNLMRLVNNILDFSKIELNKIEFETLPVDLNKLIKEIAETHFLEAQKKQIHMEYIIAPTVCNYLLDPIRITQVLNNLLSNAIKFSEKGSVKLIVDDISSTDVEHTLLFTIKDTGIGIAKEKQQLIFDSFGQEDLDTTRKYGGSGLGLAITKRILKKYGSVIQLQSEKGKGSIFSFSLTLTKYKKALPNISQNQTFSSSSLTGMKILLVEDNQINTIIIQKFLHRWGAKCTSCENGYDALKELKNNSFDLILMDLHMPVMDGFQTTQAIRVFDTDIPIFALTADSFSETRISALASGMNDFISKPFDPKELFNKAAAIQVKIST
jgi:PAS domain S-box-containing protein